MAETRMVSFGCDLTALAPRAPVDRWDDVPAVSDGDDAARDAIDVPVARLGAELVAARAAAGTSP